MINILYTGNDKVSDGILLSVLSILNTTKENISIYIITMTIEGYNPISVSFVNKLRNILKEKNNDNEVTLLDATKYFIDEMKDSPNLDNFYTPYALLRLFADKLDLPNKIIYLDTDTLAHSDISQLFNIDVSKYEFAGVVDRLGRWFIDVNYINSGVLLLNLEKIRETKIFEKTRYICTHKKMAFPDQSALNKLKTAYLKIPSKFNSQRYLKKNTVIQHFCKSIRWLPIYHTINVKPWQIDSVHKRLKIFAYDDIFNEFLKIKGE